MRFTNVRSLPSSAIDNPPPRMYGDCENIAIFSLLLKIQAGKS